MVRTLRLLALLACVSGVAAWRWHPVHAARVELTVTGSEVKATVRVYLTDLSAGITASQAGIYLAQTLRITDARGGTVTLVAQRVVPEGDRLRVELTGKALAPLGKGRLAVTVLQERFADQVNVAAVQIDGRRAQLVFLKGDPPQSLP